MSGRDDYEGTAEFPEKNVFEKAKEQWKKNKSPTIKELAGIYDEASTVTKEDFKDHKKIRKELAKHVQLIPKQIIVMERPNFVPKEEHTELMKENKNLRQFLANCKSATDKLKEDKAKLEYELEDCSALCEVLKTHIPKEKVRELITETEKETGSSGHTALRLLKQKIKLLGDKK